MGRFTDAFATAWRDFTTDGVPSSRPYQPIKSVIRALGPLLDTRFAANVSILDYEGTDDERLAEAIAEVADTGRAVDLGGEALSITAAPTNPFGVALINGRAVLPSGVSSYDTALIGVDPGPGRLVSGLEHLDTFFKSVTGGDLIRALGAGDSRMEAGVLYPLTPPELIQMAMWDCGINRVSIENIAVGGSKMSAVTGQVLPELASDVKLLIIQSGANNSTDADPVETVLAELDAVLTAIRADADGGYFQLSIILTTPVTAFRPQYNQDPKYFEQLINGYKAAAIKHSCCLADLYNYQADARYVPGFTFDETEAGQGLHPDQVKVYDFWRSFFGVHVFEGGRRNVRPGNTFWNIANVTRIALPGLTPDGYPDGIVIEVALTANGFPANGILTTIKSVGVGLNGTAVQTLYTADQVPRTLSRRGGTLWSQWTGEVYTPTFTNSWVNVAGGYKAVAAVPTAEGTVRLYGSMKDGTAAMSAFTLPTNLRPASTQRFYTDTGYIDIYATGDVTPSFTSSHVSLSGIEFVVL